MAISVHEHDGVVIVDAVLQSGLQTGALVQQRVVKKKRMKRMLNLAQRHGQLLAASSLKTSCQ